MNDDEMALHVTFDKADELESLAKELIRKGSYDYEAAELPELYDSENVDARLESHDGKRYDFLLCDLRPLCLWKHGRRHTGHSAAPDDLPVPEWVPQTVAATI